ncbi:hypothetical protein ACVFVO_13980 [Advenella kashmirensis]
MKINTPVREPKAMVRIATTDPLRKNQYPRINWWSGALRPFESVLSFCARFQALNGISFEQYEVLSDLEKNTSLSSDYDSNKIAVLLNQDQDLVRSVSVDLIDFFYCHEFRYIQDSRRLVRTFSYCKQCSQHGYHSALHSLPWISKCPFHLTPLSDGSFSTGGGNLDERSVNGMCELLRANCSTWPRPGQVDTEISRCINSSKHLPSFLRWSKKVYSASEKLSATKIWVSEEFDGRKELSYRHAIGRLKLLCGVPSLIEPLFEDLGEDWDLTIKNFQADVRNELHSLKDKPHFDYIFTYYKFISGYLKSPPPFKKKLRLAQDILNNRHGKCRCEWSLQNAGWVSHWVRIDPRMGVHVYDRCPYGHAIDTLEREWGHPDMLRLTPRAKQKLWDTFIHQSRDMNAYGLVEYSQNAKVAPDGYLRGTYNNIYSSCEWNTLSPITELLNTVAEFEIDVALIKMMKWLDGIEQGHEPENYDLPAGCIRLCDTDDGLSLIKWSLK